MTRRTRVKPIEVISREGRIKALLQEIQELHLDSILNMLKNRADDLDPAERALVAKVLKDNGIVLIAEKGDNEKEFPPEEQKRLRNRLLTTLNSGELPFHTPLDDKG